MRSHAHCEVAALHDPDPEARARLGENAVVRARFGDFEAMLQSGIDFVVLANPCGDRLGQVEAAAAQGVSVLLHAPMAPDAATASAMVTAANAAGVKIGVAVPLQAEPMLEQLRRMIADDWLGTPVVVHAMTASDRVLRTPPAPGHWQRDVHRSGSGALPKLAAESVHLTVWLTERAPMATVALAATGFTSLPEDGAVAALRLRGGALCTFASSHLCAGSSLAIHGTDGSAHLIPQQSWFLGRKVFRGDSFDYQQAGVLQMVPRDLHDEPLAGHFELHGRFARWLDDRDDFPCPGDQAALDMLALDAMQRSIASGRSETVQP